MPTSPTPDFLSLPPRASKPRFAGLTHVLDKGLPLPELECVLDSTATFIDLWKFGWGTAYLDPKIRQKVAILGQHRVRACMGGTLLEVAWAQGKADTLLSWAADVGFPCVEVSNGAVDMPVRDKRWLIAAAVKRFTVLSEVGSKDPQVDLSALRWAEETKADLEAGASLVLTEGRESGTIGLYSPEGLVREDIVSAITSAVGLHRIIFEAPRKDQQAWFIRQFGPDVNLGNVIPAEALGLEALRLGLRADTIALETHAS
jgi:phosphosulfolactate synthase